MLIVMKNGNIQLFDQPLLDFEAFRRLDIFQVDAAECRRQRLAHLDDLLGAARGDFDIEDIDIGELF